MHLRQYFSFTRTLLNQKSFSKKTEIGVRRVSSLLKGPICWCPKSPIIDDLLCCPASSPEKIANLLYNFYGAIDLVSTCYSELKNFPFF